MIAGWAFRFDDDPVWRQIAVPGCWEEQGYAPERAGPAWYRAALTIAPDSQLPRTFLRFDGAAYACEVFIDGAACGGHIGAWDGFAIEISDAVVGRDRCELLIRIEKAASLAGGPDSDALPGAYPLKQTLSGFLPYVWGHAFGGLWRDVTVERCGATYIREVYARGDADGSIAIEVVCDGDDPVAIAIADADGREVAAGRCTGGAFATVARSPSVWCPDDPQLYTCQVSVPGHQRTVRFGLRTVAAQGAQLTLNGLPIYPRMLLSWGWYEERRCPDPGPERVRQDFARLRTLGYSGVKCCLWVPPAYYLDIADELGILIWLELPMWLPDPTPFWREQTPVEYERIVRQVRCHPSIVLYSLGCELNQSVGPDVLGPLYTLVKGLGDGLPVRDNSGSGEAYGGLLNEFADYYDYHFYCDAHFFRQLVDYFSPRWRPVKPWMFGEYCDYDSFRVPPETPDGFFSADAAVNAQGARWQMDAPHQRERLAANGMLAHAEALRRSSHAQALLHRKLTIERTRLYAEISGYVITGETDTPISTAGMWDEAGALKLDAAAFAQFNGASALLIGWDKRRQWRSGGDRAAYWDTWAYRGGAAVRAHLVLSHYGERAAPAEIRWSFAIGSESPYASGAASTPGALAVGETRELTVAEFTMRHVGAPRRGTLRADAALGGARVTNVWDLWAFPDPWLQLAGAAIYDPNRRYAELAALCQGSLALGGEIPQATPTIIATGWTDQLDRYVAAGGRALLLLDEGEAVPLATVELPFWRECVRHVVQDAPYWGDFPTGDDAMLLWYGMATDRALALHGGEHQFKPMLRRVDTRTMHVHEYIAEVVWGAGTLLVTTLRLGGGHGDQPSGIGRNTAAAYLLGCMWRALARES